MDTMYNNNVNKTAKKTIVKREKIQHKRADRLSFL